MNTAATNSAPVTTRASAIPLAAADAQSAALARLETILGYEVYLEPQERRARDEQWAVLRMTEGDLVAYGTDEDDAIWNAEHE